jgi:peptidoglycan/LPS O-acetylase OafA/YrhL
LPSADHRTAPAPTNAAASRLDALDGVRGLAAFGVLVLHVWMFSYGDAGKPPKGLADLAIGELRLGVQLFFVLSGFLLYRPFVGAALDGRDGPRLGRYALRRAARILPAYWAALLGSFLLMRHLGHPMQVDPAQLPIFLLFAQNQFDETIKHLDPPMWTLAIEASFYAALPLTGALALRLGPRRGRQLALCLVLVVAGVVCTVLSTTRSWPVTLSTSLLLHLTEFGAGMAVATVVHGRRALGAWPAAGLALAGAALVIGNSAWHALMIGPQAVRSMVGDAPGVAGLALILLVLVAAPWRASLLARGPARWLGTVSFGVYLAHFPVIVALRGTGHWPETLTRQLLTVSALTLLAATLCWFLVERPAIRWARRVTRPRTRPEAQPRPHGHARSRGAAPRVLRPQPAER